MLFAAADRMSSFGDFIALSDVCDVATARVISREVRTQTMINLFGLVVCLLNCLEVDVSSLIQSPLTLTFCTILLLKAAFALCYFGLAALE